MKRLLTEVEPEPQIEEMIMMSTQDLQLHDVIETFVSLEVAWNAVKSIEWCSLKEKVFEIYPVEKKKLFPTRVIYSETDV